MGITIIQNTWDETVLVAGSSEEDLLPLEIFRVVSRPQNTADSPWSCLSSIQRTKFPGLPGHPEHLPKWAWELPGAYQVRDSWAGAPPQHPHGAEGPNFQARSASKSSVLVPVETIQAS